MRIPNNDLMVGHVYQYDYPDWQRDAWTDEDELVLNIEDAMKALRMRLEGE